MKKIHNIVGLSLGLLLSTAIIAPLCADEPIAKSVYSSKIWSIECSGGGIRSLDASGCPDLDTLKCDHTNALNSLDVSKNTALKYLYCSTTALTSLDVSKNTALTSLNCYDNDSLTSLDVSGCAALTSLSCYGNISLTMLDVSKNTALKYLYCSTTALTSLDVSKNTALTSLDCCYNNALTVLDVSKNTALETLYCYNNALTVLDVSKNTALETLYCYNNALTVLDVSKNTALTDLYCYNNELTSLDVSKNRTLKKLRCYGNKLTKLDVGGCDDLESLFCWKNALPALDISRNAKLAWLNADRNAMPLSSVAKLLQDITAYSINYYTVSSQMPTVRLKVNEDYSLLRELTFNGIETDVTVEDKNGNPLPSTAYVMAAGNISVRFTQDGTYRIRLKNTSLRSKEYDYSNFSDWYPIYGSNYSDVLYPVECVLTFEVGDWSDNPSDPNNPNDPGNPGGPGEVPTDPTANEASLAAAPFAYVQGRTVYLSDGLGEVEAFTSTGQRVYRGFDRCFTLPHPGVYVLRVVADGRRSKLIAQ